MYSMLQIRTGVLLLGPAACGKSTVIRVLKKALGGGLSPDAGGGCVATWEIFPKAMSKSKLFGFINGQGTQEWVDGVVTAAVRAKECGKQMNKHG